MTHEIGNLPPNPLLLRNAMPGLIDGTQPRPSCWPCDDENIHNLHIKVNRQAIVRSSPVQEVKSKDGGHGGGDRLQLC